eukprot:Nitzschia sp. Nitz4//scaffold4_size323378//74544//75386//NITZ4_000635-RA/size323378-processed-gene-0.337-mRNA-1//-1//CDS//3329553324//4756//frame0
MLVGNARVAMWASHVSTGARTRGLSSVSQSEVGKFSDLSKSWWDPRKNPLIGMNSIRMEYIVKQVNSQSSEVSDKVAASPLTGKKALDVGCGGGLLSESLARLGATVTGVDPSQELVEAAKLHGSLHPLTRNIDYRGGWSVEQLAASIEKEEDKYDVVCLLEVLEHVTDVDSVISSIHQLLKPNGKLFLSTMNRTVKSHLVAILGAEYIMGYLPPGTHDWNDFRSPEEVQAILQRNGFEQEHVTGMVIPVTSPPLFGNWNWKFDPNDTDINWIGTYHKSS